MKLEQEIKKIKKEYTVDQINLSNEEPKFLKVQNYEVEFKGQNFSREKLIKGNKDGSAVIIVPLTKEMESLVVIQPRVFTKSKVLVEMPAGYIDLGETPEEAAQRELLEETGYVSKNLICLKSYYQDQGISSAYNYVFLALDAEKKYSQKLDETEYIRYLQCRFNDIINLEENGYIEDANSIIAINETKKYLRKEMKK